MELSIFLTRTVRTIDYSVKIRVNPDQKGVDLNVKHSIVRLKIVSEVAY